MARLTFHIRGARKGLKVINRWIGWTLAAVALATAASAGLACDQHAQAAEAKDMKAVAANDAAKGCDMPCCAHANSAVNDKIAADAVAEKPCSAQAPKGCPKKATATAAAVAKSEPAKEAAKAEPPADPGTNR
jgi:hypothetical protein